VTTTSTTTQLPAAVKAPSTPLALPAPYDLLVNVKGGGLNRAKPMRSSKVPPVALCDLSPDNAKPLKTGKATSAGIPRQRAPQVRLKKSRKAPPVLQALILLPCPGQLHPTGIRAPRLIWQTEEVVNDHRLHPEARLQWSTSEWGNHPSIRQTRRSSTPKGALNRFIAKYGMGSTTVRQPG